MSYQELNNVKTVTLSGVDKQTNKKNPTEIEGYLIRVERRPNKFDPNKPQNYYVFLTPEGERGVYAKAGINSALKSARLGVMTKLVSTNETLDTGKGFPMKVFKGMQDSTNTLDQDTLESYSVPTSFIVSEDEEESVVEDEVQEPVMERPKAPARAASVDVSRQAKIQALLNSKKS